MTPPYDVDHFIRKFEAIPEELWNDDGNYYKESDPKCKCVYGHLGVTNSSFKRNAETDAIYNLFDQLDLYVTKVNDGEDQKYQQPTPKQRVLAALKDIKDREK